MTLPALVAPDSFKGTFSAAEVAAAIAKGLRDGGQAAEEMPVADGGEGTMDALLAARGGERFTVETTDPLGRAIDADWALLGDGKSGAVDVAQASGLWRVAEDERDPWAASTYGTGELIAAAVEGGAKTVLLGVGGSATTDGGAGAIEALRDAGLKKGDFALQLACDVHTPFEDAPRVFAPQKGADAKMVKRLEKRLAKLAEDLPLDPRGVDCSGAAGGIAGGLWATYGAKLEPGAPMVLDALDFDERMRAARFVITGEGRIDPQTLTGKLVGELATRCRQGGVACYAVVGKNDLDDFGARVIDLSEVLEATNPEEMEAAGRRLAEQTRP